jgi:2-dehydropantoate 2-reductase
MSTVGVLGPGAVGGTLAVRLALGGARVVCVARPETADSIIHHGLTLEVGDEELTARPETVELLAEPVDVLLVTLKAPTLDRGLSRIGSDAVAGGIVVTLLNGLEHPATVRRRLGAPTAAGSVSYFQAYRDGPATVVQLTETFVVTVASADVPPEELQRALAPLAVEGVDLRFGPDEATVLWEKAARLGPLAAVTALAQQPIGQLRADPEWRTQLVAGIDESCAVAAADGVELSPAAQLAILDAMPPDLLTSAARDVAAGTPSELDAIVGSIVRAGRRTGVPTPTLDSLLERLGV